MGGGNKAIVLSNNRCVTMGKTPELDLKESTIELWFRPMFQKGVTGNPCIIGKRSDSGKTRFSVHLKNDYSSIAVWNGWQAKWCSTPGSPLQPESWYHLAVTATEQKNTTYLNGAPCIEGGVSLFDFRNIEVPLWIGCNGKPGQEAFDGHVDEVAICSQALSEKEVMDHVDAMDPSIKTRRIEIASAKAKKRAELITNRPKEFSRRLNAPELMARGESFVYRDKHLQAISLPVARIGASLIQLNGKAELCPACPERTSWGIRKRRRVVPRSTTSHLFLCSFDSLSL